MPKLAVQPMQITDVFAVPTVGLMALGFAGTASLGVELAGHLVTAIERRKRARLPRKKAKPRLVTVANSGHTI